MRKYPDTTPKLQRPQYLFMGKAQICIHHVTPESKTLRQSLLPAGQLSPAFAEQRQRLPRCSTRVPVWVMSHVRSPRAGDVMLQRQHRASSSHVPLQQVPLHPRTRRPSGRATTPLLAGKQMSFPHPSYPAKLFQGFDNLRDCHKFAVCYSMGHPCAWKNKTVIHRKMMQIREQ